MMDRKELEERLEEFHDRQFRVFVAFRSNLLKEFDEKSMTPAEEARERRKEMSVSENTSSGIKWGFREGVRWFRQQTLKNNRPWDDYDTELFLNIEKEGTA